MPPPHRSQLRNDVPFLTSSILASAGFRHAFSLRAGGVSEPPFTQLNLGRSVGDQVSAVAENHRRFAEAVGYRSGELYELSQVHGAVVCAPGPGEDPAEYRSREGDALLAVHSGQVVGVRTADCLAILIGDPRSGCVAAVHAGWRGVVAGVVPAAVAGLRASSRIADGGDGGPQVPAGRFLAAIMPHIRVCCFEVGIEVASALRSAAPDVDAVAAPHTPGKTRVDLAALVRAQLRGAGVSPERIDDVPGCTACEPERFFSFRRDRDRSGRHLAIIAAGSTEHV
ncbi:MAG: peptidoglycan editing factor PgeF [Myxococcales bacterium]|nr:peptidoglycan editing factor PgeF [Myxococcales bacterium]